MPFNFASVLIYSFTAILAITLGAFFYRSVQNAQVTLKEDRNLNAVSPEIPPGAKVVPKDDRAKTASPVAAEPQPKQPAAPVEPELPQAQVIPIKSESETIKPPAVMPDLAPLSVPDWVPTPISDIIPGKVTLKAIADAAVTIGPHGSMEEFNGGAVRDLPLRGNEQFFIAQYDLEKVQGWSITKAHWYGKVTTGQVHTLAFSTLPTPWQEGSGTLAEPAQGGATLRWADQGKTQWREDGIPLNYLIRGGGNSLMCTGSPVEEEQEPYAWVQIELNPALVQALIAGTAHGLAVTDEKGQLGTTATIASRENSRFNHYIEVVGTRSDISAPGTVADLTAWGHPDLRRESTVGVVLSWTATGDDGDRGQAFSYEIRYAPAPANQERTRLLPPELTPRPQRSGNPDKAIIEGLEPDTMYTFFVRAIDEVGQAGVAASATLKTPSAISMPTVEQPQAHPADSIDIVNGSLTLRVVEETAVVDPVSGDVRLGRERKGRTEDLSSFVWDRSSRTLRLRAARNETVGTLLVLGPRQQTFPVIDFSTKPFERAGKPMGGDGFRFHRVWFSMAPHQGGKRTWTGDALIPLASGKLAMDVMPNKIQGQTVQTVYAELQIPTAAEPGTYVGEIVISGAEGASTTINVLLDVLPAVLPPEPSFTIELLAPATLAMLYRKDVSNNDDASPVEMSYYRMAHEHRCALAIMPYLSNGSFVPPFMPPTSGKGLDLDISSWDAWDSRFRRLLDGTGFMGSSAGSAPVPHIILPAFDNWPTPFDEGFLCVGQEISLPDSGIQVYGGRSSEIDACVAPDYWRGVRAALRLFRDHFRARGWRETTAHFWLNNNPSTSYTGKAPLWNLGTPTYRDDFLALEGYARFARADFATWPRDGLAIRVAITNGTVLGSMGSGLFTLLTVSDTDPYTWKELRRRSESTGEKLWLQTPFVPISDMLASTEAMALSYFLAGADGWSIRETIGRPENWLRATHQSLLYCGTPLGTETAVSSMRLKMLRRTVQDIEYMILLQKKMGWNRKQLADFVYRQLPALAQHPEDIDARDLYLLRRAVQQALAAP